MPIPGDTVVLVKFRDRSPHYHTSGSERPASSWHHEARWLSNWHHDGTGADIIAYRIVPTPEDLTPL
ncbi:hypothetical protein [Rhizobium hidalgonense]|uniref:hypothetical protein n=1 Tax=Rhizobium hidalgonense TaxID=1538159 RepID=UPI002871BA06|nr:hypothetical protein [Rhizobium hidalgonense]MDR9813085.1 hypothetical protein [Rhizobium hidalgonense]